MKFDPIIYSIGEWYTWEVTRLDDIAYYLFLKVWWENRKGDHSLINFSTQYNMIKDYNLNKYYYSYYYKEAKLLIRKEKIEKLYKMVRPELIKVYEDTVDRINGMETESDTKLYSYNLLSVSTYGIGEIDKSIISVEPTDTITTAINLDGQGKTCILNMASNTKPGGGVKSGAVAQEECLFRCTDLFKTVKDMYYPLGMDEGLYTMDSMIIKDKDYNLLDKPIFVDCVTIPAINLNKYEMLRQSYEKITEEKIDMILKLAHSYMCDNLVLGAWGCGVYNNDPDYISKTFLKMIMLGGYEFKKIVFGVINDHNSVDNNYEIFKKNLT